MKTADATRPGLFIPTPSLLVQPSPLSFPVWQPCMGSEHQQSGGTFMDRAIAVVPIHRACPTSAKHNGESGCFMIVM